MSPPSIAASLEKIAAVANASTQNAKRLTAPPLEINVEEALRSATGDYDLMRDLIDLFMMDCPKLLLELNGALKARDAFRLARAAHTIKGSCGYFAVPSAYAAALNLERIAKAGDLEAAEGALRHLTEQMERLRPALESFRVFLLTPPPLSLADSGFAGTSGGR